MSMFMFIGLGSIAYYSKELFRKDRLFRLACKHVWDTLISGVLTGYHALCFGFYAGIFLVRIILQGIAWFGGASTAHPDETAEQDEQRVRPSLDTISTELDTDAKIAGREIAEWAGKTATWARNASAWMSNKVAPCASSSVKADVPRAEAPAAAAGGAGKGANDAVVPAAVTGRADDASGVKSERKRPRNITEDDETSLRNIINSSMYFQLYKNVLEAKEKNTPLPDGGPNKVVTATIIELLCKVIDDVDSHEYFKYLIHASKKAKTTRASNGEAAPK